MSKDTKRIICSMKGVNRVHPPQKKVLNDIWLSYYYGAKIGVLGLNGSGKSSLLRILAGQDTQYTGEVEFTKGFSVGFLEQEPRLDDEKTVRQIVEEGVQELVDIQTAYNEVNEKFGEEMSDDVMDALIKQQGNLQEKMDKFDIWDLDSRLDMAMDALRCPPADTKVSVISGGERRRIALCRLLLQKPDVLLLDEPTNHLDAESVQWLEQHLARYEGTVIAVTHDRYFLDNVAGWILELDRGEGIPFEGNYSSWLEQKQIRLEQEQKTESKLQKTLKKELEWVHSSQKARQAKGKARLAAYEDLLKQQTEKRDEEMEIYIPPGPRLGDVVIEAKNVSKAFGEKVLYEDLNFSLPRGGIVGIIGANGAGKTTLFRMITGQDKPDSGEFKVGETVKLAYVDQSRDALDDSKMVWEAISDSLDIINIGGRDVPARAYASRFNFAGQDQQKKVGVLSGGERNRVHLARILKSECNVILLDEPTNDLDVNTLRALEEAMLNFAGCAVIISHDRWFLDRVATHILAFEGNSSAVWFDGNFSDYEEDKKRRLGVDADQPHRIRYKAMTR